MADYPKIQVRGLRFLIITDVDDGNLHEAAVRYDCLEVSIEAHCYGKDREEAFLLAIQELRLLVLSHQARCDTCQLNITYNLVGDEDDPPPSVPDEGDHLP